MAILNDNTILQYLDSLLKYNSFTKASEDLYISQPYLTQVVKKTEKHIGVKIIDRGNNQIRLTEAGLCHQNRRAADSRKFSFAAVFARVY